MQLFAENIPQPNGSVTLERVASMNSSTTGKSYDIERDVLRATFMTRRNSLPSQSGGIELDVIHRLIADRRDFENSMEIDSKHLDKEIKQQEFNQKALQKMMQYQMFN